MKQMNSIIKMMVVSCALVLPNFAQSQSQTKQENWSGSFNNLGNKDGLWKLIEQNVTISECYFQNGLLTEEKMNNDFFGKDTLLLQMQLNQSKDTLLYFNYRFTNQTEFASIDYYSGFLVDSLTKNKSFFDESFSGAFYVCSEMFFYGAYVDNYADLVEVVKKKKMVMSLIIG